MTNIDVTIPLEGGGCVSGVFSLPPRSVPASGTAVAVAHGAGNDMTAPLIVSFAEGLGAAGFPALRFNFPYRERGKKAPDSQGTLEKTWRSVCRFLREERHCPVERIVAAGKSMGGRVASQMTAGGSLPAAGLVFLGYPLHRPGNPEQLKDAHLYSVAVPMLFFAGTRDSLCHLERLREVLARLEAPWRLEVIEGGDHSFNLPKRAALTEEAVREDMVRLTVEWLRQLP